MPFHNIKGWAGVARDGWSISGVTQFQTGPPFTVGNNTDFAGIGESSFQPFNYAGGAEISNPVFGGQYINTRNASGQPIFTPPAPGTFWNQTKHLFYGPGLQKLNVALVNAFNITHIRKTT